MRTGRVLHLGRGIAKRGRRMPVGALHQDWGPVASSSTPDSQCPRRAMNRKAVRGVCSGWEPARLVQRAATKRNGQLSRY
jgi:hypothetical protein